MAGWRLGFLSHLNAEQLAPVRDRRIELCLDLSKDGSGFERWNRVTEDLIGQGFTITVDRIVLRAP
ncbi:hypothetical protein GCM10027341_15240 [Spirosoma knui]